MHGLFEQATCFAEKLRRKKQRIKMKKTANRLFFIDMIHSGLISLSKLGG